MSDLISRQAIIDRLNRLIEVERKQGTDKMGYGRERVNAYEHMIWAIESECLHPTIDVRKNIHGHWTNDGIMFQCSECGMRFDVDAMYWNGCPNCGADMREPKEEKGTE